MCRVGSGGLQKHARGIMENQMEKNTDVEMRTTMDSRLLVSEIGLRIFD